MAANDFAMSIEPSPESPHLSRWHYGFRALHFAAILCGALLAVAESIGLMGTLGLVFLILLVVMHVLGNALVTRLNRESTWQIDAEQVDPALLPPVDGWRADIGPPRISHLGMRTSGGWLVGTMTCLGMLAGGILGGLFFAQEPTVAGMVVGTVSAVVLGGFFGFMTSSCSKVVLAAWWQAKAECGPRPRHVAV
jgi:hypothetical protein